MTTTVSVSEFKQHCLDLIRRVEQDGTAIDLTRRGKVVARLVPTTAVAQDQAPWLRLRGRGRLHAQPGESVVDADAFGAVGGHSA